MSSVPAVAILFNNGGRGEAGLTLMGVNAGYAKALYFTLANDMISPNFLKPIDRASYRIERCHVRTKRNASSPALRGRAAWRLDSESCPSRARERRSRAPSPAAAGFLFLGSGWRRGSRSTPTTAGSDQDGVNIFMGSESLATSCPCIPRQSFYIPPPRSLDIILCPIRRFAVVVAVEPTAERCQKCSQAVG